MIILNTLTLNQQDLSPFPETIGERGRFQQDIDIFWVAVYCDTGGVLSVLSVSLPEKLASDLEDYARKTGRSKSGIVKESVSLYLWESWFRKIRKPISVKAKKMGIVTEEDVYKAIS
jgi:predicted transcriptional regulator